MSDKNGITIADVAKIAKLGRILANADIIYEEIAGFDVRKTLALAELDKLAKDISTKKNELASSNTELSNSKLSIESLKKDNEAAKARVIEEGKLEAKKLVDEANAKVALLKSEEAAINKRIEAATSDYNTILARIESAHKQEKDLIAALNKLREDTRAKLGL